jgi:hypothetical protein
MRKSCKDNFSAAKVLISYCTESIIPRERLLPSGVTSVRDLDMLQTNMILPKVYRVLLCDLGLDAGNSRGASNRPEELSYTYLRKLLTKVLKKGDE